MARLFLIGSMGAGKTTMGRQLARSLGYPFFDSDHELESRTGVDIPTIFDFEGEQGFREREHCIIGELTQRDDIVLATGGGAVLNEENRAHLSERGFVVYLKVSVNEQLRRTSNDKNRPILQTTNKREKLNALAEQRNPLYESIADYSVDTSRLYANRIKHKIISAFKHYKNAHQD